MCLPVTEGAEVTDAEADWSAVEQLDGLIVFLCCGDLVFWPLNRLVWMKRSFALTHD